MIGVALVIRKLRKNGKQIIVTTLFLSLTTFFVVSLCYWGMFYFTNIPNYVAFIFGGIASAKAPAPVLSIVKEFTTDGPVTRTLIPMAALDDIIGIVVFFSVISIITASNTGQSTSLYVTLLMMIVLPVLIGISVGVVGGFILKKKCSKELTIKKISSLIIIALCIGLIINQYCLSEPVINFMIIGMAFSPTFAYIVTDERLNEIISDFSVALQFLMIIVFINLGAPLDFHLILCAGVFTLVYILSIAVGKYTGAFMGAKITGLADTVQKYLGFTLLTHLGVSLVFTGIAVTSVSSFDIDSAIIIQGTIAAAVINEIIAVIVSKNVFEWADEFQSK